MNDIKNCLKSKSNIFCESFTDCDNLCICSNNQGIRDILQASVSIIISSYKIINTKNTYKLLVKGYKILNILYSSNNNSGEVFSEKFSKQFINVLNNFYICDIKNVTTEVIFADLIKQCDREITLTIIYNINVDTLITYYVSPDFDNWQKGVGCDSYQIIGNACNSQLYNNNNKNNNQYNKCNRNTMKIHKFR